MREEASASAYACVATNNKSPTQNWPIHLNFQMTLPPQPMNGERHFGFFFFYGRIPSDKLQMQMRAPQFAANLLEIDRLCAAQI